MSRRCTPAEHLRAMSSSVNLLIILFLWVTTITLGSRREDTSWQFEVRQGLENSSKCHIRHHWRHMIHPYSMTCFQCLDQERYGVILYHGTTPFGGAKVVNCDFLQTPYSVSMLQPEKGVHMAQFLFRGSPYPECVRVTYRKDGAKWVRQALPCVNAGKMSRLVTSLQTYVNGWTLQDDLPNLGIVRALYEPRERIVEGCPKVRTMTNKNNMFSMTCYECNEEFLAVVHHVRELMGVAAVGTCRSPDLESSISAYPSPSGGEHQLQFYTKDNQCRMLGYTRSRQVQGGYSVSVKPSCLYKRQPRLVKGAEFLSAVGYINGWQSEQETDPNHATRTMREKNPYNIPG